MLERRAVAVGVGGWLVGVLSVSPLVGAEVLVAIAVLVGRGEFGGIFLTVLVGSGIAVLVFVGAAVQVGQNTKVVEVGD